MSQTESSALTVSRRWLRPHSDHDPECTVVWLVGDFDLSTNAALWATFESAAALNSVDLVVDLSRVQFLSAVSVRVFARVADLLGEQGRRLVLRHPAPCSRRVFDLCEMGDLLEPRTIDLRGDAESSALGSWVAVPPSTRDDTPTAATPSESYVESEASFLVSMAVRQLMDARAAKVSSRRGG